MKNIILFSLLILSCLGAKAQGVIYLKSPADYQVTAISANGDWACGAYMDESGSSYGFRWNLQTNKIEMLGNAGAPTGVSNDGVVAGSFSTTVEGAGKIEVAGTWDGSWTMLELPNKKGCWASGISPDGQYVVGTDNDYTSYIWKNGEVYQTLTSDLENIAYCVSNDGSLAGGWAYNPYTNKNRTSVYWNNGDIHYVTPTTGGQIWMAVKKFTPDNKKLLFWGGYKTDPAAPEKGNGMRAILDLETNDTTLIYPTSDMPFNFDLYDMSADCKVVGMEQDMDGVEHAIIWDGGETMMLEQYLESQGADFSDQGVYQLDENEYLLARGLAVSSDAKTYGVLYYGDDYIETGYFYSMIVKLGEITTHTCPVNIEAAQMRGLKTAKVTWSAPLGDKSNLQGYDVYRDDVKVNSELVTECEYYDMDLEEGSYKYNIVAVYEDGESEKSVAANVTIEEQKIQAPANLITRQKSYATAYATWQHPATNLIDINYYENSTSDVEGFGGGSVSFESGVLYPAKQMNLYDSYRLTAVSFYPLTEQGSWIINVYTRNDDGTLHNLGSFPVTQELNYGVKNTVTLSRQITLQKNHDLIIGIQTNVTNESYAVQGVFAGCLEAGYTDLIRQIGEDDFYSVNIASAGGVGTYDMAWGTAAHLAPVGVSTDIDNVDHYEVSVDGWVPEEVKETHYSNSNLSEGEHIIEVIAVYENGKYSDWVSSNLTITPNEAALKAVTPVIWTADNAVVANWKAPKDDDATTMGYCNDEIAARCPNATDDCSQFYARVDYTNKETAPYDGYLVKSVSFLPLSESSFYLQLNANDDLVAEFEPEEVTVGEWNTFELEEPVVIDCNKTYHFVVDCRECPSGEAPIAIDTFNSATDYSSMMSTEGDISYYGWSGIYDYTGLNGNWMMRINIADPDAKDFDIKGYDVYLDDAKVSDLQTSREYITSVTYNDLHHLRVDAHYTQAGKTVEGEDVYFQAMNKDGIENINENDNENENLYNVLGQRVSKNAKGIVITRGKKYLAK